MRNFVFNLTTAFMFLMGTALAQDAPEISDDYPGLKANGGILVVAMSDVQSAVAAYQRVYGNMPTSWQEIKGCGLFDKDLVAYNMQVIDPDDKKIDFKGDVYLDVDTLSDTSGDLLMFSMWGLAGNRISRMKLEYYPGYAELFANIKQDPDLDAENSNILDAWLENEDQLIQFGHLHMIGKLLSDYRDIHGEYPEHLSEMVSAGIGPLTMSSINPVTGVPYRYDGSRGDISYSRTIDGTGYMLQHVDLHFNPTIQFSY